MAGFSNAALSEMSDGLTVNEISLHDGDPGSAGTDNEISGNGYARKSGSFGAASNGVRALSTAVDFAGPANQSVTYYGLWQNSTFKGGFEITTGDVSFNASGEYQLGTDTEIDVANPTP